MKEEKEIPTAEAYMNICLGGNMNIATLKPIVFQEMMIEFAKIIRKDIVDKLYEYSCDHCADAMDEIYPESNIK